MTFSSLKASTRAFVTSPVFPILLVNFIGSLGYGIILPFLAFLVLDFGGNEVLYGLIAATYPLFQMIGAPLLGRMSDQIGRKKVLLISQAGTLLSWLIFLLAFVLPVEELFAFETRQFGTISLTAPLLIVLVARSLDGLTGGNISVANAYLSDVSPPEDLKRNFGKMSSSMSLGFILGPALAGLLASLPYGNVITIMTAALISVGGVLAIRFFLPDIAMKKEVYPCPEAKMKKTYGVEVGDCFQEGLPAKNGWTTVVRQPGAPLMIALFFLIFMAYNLFFATFSMYSSTGLNWSSQQVGYFFTLMSAVMIIGQGPVLSRLSRRYSEEQLFAAGSLIMVATFTCLTSQSPLIIFVAAVLYGLGNGIMWPSYLTMLSKVGERSRQGSLQGIANGFGSLASIFGLIFGGFLLALLAQQIYLLSAVLLLVIALIGFAQVRKKQAIRA